MTTNTLVFVCVRVYVCVCDMQIDKGNKMMTIIGQQQQLQRKKARHKKPSQFV